MHKSFFNKIQQQLGLWQMAHCPCFGRKKKVTTVIRNQEINNNNNEDQNPNSDNPSVQKVKTEPKLNLLDSGDNAKGNAIIFSYRELAKATNNFREESIVGEGGFGAVYKGQLEKTSQMVAVKLLNQSGLQGDKEFLVEVLMLSLLRHPNLVNLIGYCAEGKQRLLVYELMPLGSLESHLHDLTPDMAPLDWNTRMTIAAGAAKGLNFLHNQADPPVIYRDLKSSNILLGEGFHTKLSDFGLAKFGPEEDKSHVSTRVMGTHGYCAPEYASTGKLTIKSDIYSFGVVLLELITGHRALDLRREKGKQLLVAWARPLLRDRQSFKLLADPRLKGQFSERVLCKTMEVALMCLREDPQLRPSMVDVVHALNYLASQRYDPKDTGGSGRERRSPRVDSNSTSPKSNVPLNKNQERERAVAEAKMWGETWRGKTN